MTMRHLFALTALVCAALLSSRSARAQFTQQGPKLVGTGAVGTAFQGQSVALSADGSTAIVGGSTDDSSGAAWVWTRSAGVWNQQGLKLVGADAAGYAGQGISVSLSADGNTAIVGGWGDNGGIGAAWIWTRSGGVWTQQGTKLVGSGAVGNAGQGFSVSLSADGNTAMVGGWSDNFGAGAAWVWTRDGGGAWNQQGNKLIGSGATGNASQGSSVSLSADGNTAFVGGSADGSNAGAAWVWARSGGVWTQQGTKLVGSGASGNAQQGTSAHISADGNTAIVGGSADNSNAGAAWVWVRSGGVWTQQGTKLVGSGASSSAGQGVSVHLSDDGNTAIVAANFDTNLAGAAWIWTRSGGVWTQQGNKLVGSGAVGPDVGPLFRSASAFLGPDGNTAIVGGARDNGGAGAAWIWTRSGGVWTQQGNKLVGSGAAGKAEQGISVALSADGSTAIVGGYQDQSDIGAAWVWTRSGAVWTQQGSKLVGSGAVGSAQQGVSVALSADGNTAIVGGYQDNRDPSVPFISSVGAAWVWTRSAGVWTQQGTKLVGSGAQGNGGQGASVSISADGNTAIVGGIFDNGSAGAVWVWIRSGGVWTQQGPKLVGSGATVSKAGQGYSVSLSADGNTAIVGGISDNVNRGAAWVWTRSSGIWTQQGSKLVGSGAVGDGYQGFSVSLSADGNTAIVGGPIDNNHAGAAWIWIRSIGIWTQQGVKLVGSGAVGDAVEQGGAVSLSADGNTAVVGGTGDNIATGATWVWKRSGGVWVQQGAKLVGNGSSVQARQGASVALSADGKTTVVGSYQDNNNAGAALVFVMQADLSITKTVVGSGLFGAGANRTYTINVVNNGPGSASGVVVTDVLPAGTTFVSSTASQGSCNGTTTVTCSLGALANGGSATVSLVMKTSSTPGVVTNTATVLAAEFDSNTANNSATSTITTVDPAQLPAASEWALIALVGVLAMLGALRTRA